MKKLPERTVQFLLLVIFALIVFNFAAVTDRATSMKFSVALVCLLAILVVNQLFGEMEPAPRRLSPEAKDLYYSDLLSRNVLVKYTPGRMKREVIADIIDYAKEKVPVVLVSPSAKSAGYLQRFTEDVERGRIQVVELSAKGDAEAGETITKVPMKNLDSLNGLLSRREDSLVVLDSLSDIIREKGFDDTIRLLEGWLETGKEGGLRVMALLNQDAHKKIDMSVLEDLFQGMAQIRQGRLRQVI